MEAIERRCHCGGTMVLASALGHELRLRVGVVPVGEVSQGRVIQFVCPTCHEAVQLFDGTRRGWFFYPVGLAVIALGMEFMASVARPAVEGCPIRFGFKCPLLWDALRRTGRDEIRHCRGCRQDVHFCRTLDEAQLLSRQGVCVALDPSLVRTAGDLDPTPPEGSYVGRLA
jgi:hypothetical protein